ncbi:MAG: hypothetical protein WB421_17880 [Terriglobales bacterium]
MRSKDRVSGTPDKYKVCLPTLIENVVQIEFMSAEIPNTLYTTHIRFFNFAINVADVISHITIPVQPGIYSTSDLMAFMTANMFLADTYLITNDTLDPSIVWFTFNEHKSQIGINVSSEVSEVFIDNFTDPMFGFAEGEVYADIDTGVYYGTSLSAFNVPSFIYLCIDEIQNQAVTNFMTASNAATPHNMIARIQMNAEILHFVMTASNGSDFRRPLTMSNSINLSTLSITFLGPDGGAVDFQGVEHSLILKVTSKRLTRF